MKVAIARPLDWEYLHEEVNLSFMALDRTGFERLHFLSTPRGGGIAEKRDMMALRSLLDEFDFTWMIDSDMIFPPTVLRDMVTTMLDTGAGLVGNVCFKGYEPYHPLIWRKDGEGLLLPWVDYQFGDVVEAGATGCGCLLIDNRVLADLPRPWFQVVEQTVSSKDGDGVQTIRTGEDVYFTRKAVEAGHKLVINTSYDVGHMRTISVDRHFWIMRHVLGKLGSWERIGKLFCKLDDQQWSEEHLGPLPGVEITGKEQEVRRNG